MDQTRTKINNQVNNIREVIRINAYSHISNSMWINILNKLYIDIRNQVNNGTI